MAERSEIRSGRGAASNPAGRFESQSAEAVDDGWGILDEPLPKLATIVRPEKAKRIITRNDSPDIPFRQSINPYRGCEHGCVYCVDGDTPILYADGRHRPIKAARAGDVIVGTEPNGHYWRYVETRISDHWSTIKPGYRIALADGTELIASGDHRFWTERGWKFVTGKGGGPDQRPHLTPNNRLMGTGAFAAQPDDSAEYRRGYLCGMIRGDGTVRSYCYNGRRRGVDTQHHFRLALADADALERSERFLASFEVKTHEFEFQQAVGERRAMRAIRTHRRASVEAVRSLIAWPATRTDAWIKGFLAGIFDAEGSHDVAGAIRISNTDLSIIAETTWALDRLGFSWCHERIEYQDRKPMTYVRIKGGLAEKLRFFHLTDPAITRKRSISGVHLKSSVDLRVMRIEPLGQARRMYDITTGTGDFIANGVLSHNCYARPSHAYVNLSPGLDFETKLFYKDGAVELLRRELAAKNYRCSPIAFGANTDPYQPIERKYRVTRCLLELLSECDHPATIVTKGAAMIARDIDLLASMAARRLIAVFVSVTTLDTDLKHRLEPRAASPAARLRMIKELTAAGVPVGVMVAPVIPVLTDHEAERILEAAAAAGATGAGHVMLRLPHEVAPLFREWLAVHEPLKAAHVLSRIHDLRGGRDNDPRFGSRMRGEGPFADLFRKRFEVAKRRFGLDREDPRFHLDTTRFRPPRPLSAPAGQPPESPQQSLF